MRIIRVNDALHWTGEVVGERLGSCMGLIIHWNRSLLRVLATTPNLSNAHGSHNSPTLTMTPEFDVQERFNTSELNERALHSSQASNSIDENSPFSQCTPFSIRDISHVEGFVHVR